MTDGLPQPQRSFALTAVAIAMTMAVLDTGIVNVALPAIGRGFRVSAAESIWIINAYQLAVTVLLLPFAALGDILGHKSTRGGWPSSRLVRSRAPAPIHFLCWRALASCKAWALPAS